MRQVHSAKGANMKSLTSLIVLASLVGGVPILTGCEREISHTESVKETPGGGVKKTETTVKENPDGTISKETETKRVNP
jgi:hypothetical protein